MLSTKKEELKEHEISTLREWLSADGATLFAVVLKARVNENQIEATKKFADPRQPRMSEEGKALMDKSLPYRNALDVLKEVADIKTKLYRTKLIQE